MNRNEETVCAPATGSGGAISIIRISGPESTGICSRVFVPVSGSVDLSKLKGYSLVYGEIRSDGELIDDVLVSVFRAPHSYTGEDSVEISCHASPYIVKKIIELLVSHGAVAAHPGEFTRRAFMNGRMDLSQAEAVADIIASETRAAHKLAVSQMRGGFSDEIQKLRSELLHFASLIELELDFGEEDVEFANRDDLKAIVIRVRGMAERLAATFSAGNALKNGIPVVIAGKPNSGKSTLLNALLMEDRAIVSEIPGTTRDTIEDTIVIDGIEYRFIDTAGMRDTTDIIESLGIQRTIEKVKQASVVLYIDEATDEPVMINKRIEGIREIINGQSQRLIVLINKIDKAPGSTGKMAGGIVLRPRESLVFLSAKEKTGLDELRSRLADPELAQALNSNDVIITNARHYESLVHVSESLGRVIEGFDSGIPEDLIATDIRQAIHYLGEITGQITNDEILGNIFRNFCIGK